MNDLEEYLNLAKELALEAGKIMQKYFLAEEIGLETKQDETPVTIADTKINSLIIESVKQKYPDHGVLGEEESYNLDKSQLWIVDPLDGTQNFANQIPLFAFSRAFVVEGVPQVAVVFDPMANRLIYASKGHGAYENGKKLKLPTNLSKQNLTIGSWVVGGIDNSIFNNKSINGDVASAYSEAGNINDNDDFPIAYALAVVAAGGLDALVSSIKTPWDVGAGSLIAMEAGAKVTDLLGNEVVDWSKDANGILAASPQVHSYLLSLLKPVLESRK